MLEGRESDQLLRRLVRDAEAGCCTSERSASSRPRSSSPLTKCRALLSKTAIRQPERLSRDANRRVRGKIKVLEDDPIRTQPGAEVRPLWGHDDHPLYRLRIGDYRVLDFVLSTEVRVTEIVHRPQGYRGLD